MELLADLQQHHLQHGLAGVKGRNPIEHGVASARVDLGPVVVQQTRNRAELFLRRKTIQLLHQIVELIDGLLVVILQKMQVAKVGVRLAVLKIRKSS